jgi:hypothetical protein
MYTDFVLTHTGHISPTGYLWTLFAGSNEAWLFVLFELQNGPT